VASILFEAGSNNGTYVNGKRLQVGVLGHQEEITIANNRIRVELPELSNAEFAPREATQRKW
jgi:pSer/pThr/pTyr-binding forkhead associated (FHA) protein